MVYTIAAAWSPGASSSAQGRDDKHRLFEALFKPLVKVEWVVSEHAPARLGRGFIPASLLNLPTGDGLPRFHKGPLYFSVTGSGKGHVLDLSDQLGQGGQITEFGGEITVNASHMLFIGSLARSSQVFIKRGFGYSILAPMDGGDGSKHVEFDGTHFVMPKLVTPRIETTEAAPSERAVLRNPELTQKAVWRYAKTEYVIFIRPGTQVVPGNHEERKKKFPEFYEIFELDRLRQVDAPRISNAQLQQALREAPPMK